ncbi:hypothetical protein C8R44DRAFT_363556 [Mycena epipterygia]|nr:hypothetical protein C8R44DRAFT_363556 [Mycena epipterygia]
MESRGSELRSRLDAIEQRMAALESQMALLRKEREDILEELAAIVYPVLTLPSDITSEIFLHWYAARPLNQYRPPPPSPLPLASTCKLWRAIALSTCRLWTHLRFGGSASAALGHRLQNWLPRAGALPVDLRIHLPTSSSQECEAVFRIIAQYSSRWGSLDITSDHPISIPADIHGSFSSLTRISLQIRGWSDGDALTEIPAFLNAPRLQEVALTNVALFDWQISLPWTQLTALSLWHQTVDECLEILTHTPNLEVLTFSYGSSMDPVTSAPCVLRHLHTISIGCDESHELLDYLILPSLDRANFFSDECAERVKPLITRSGCSPRTLELDIYDPDFLFIHLYMLSLPSVRHLQMSLLGGTSDEFSSLFRTIAEDPAFLPALESLIIDKCQTNIDLLSLVPMLAARTTGTDGVSKLKSFRLSFDQEEQSQDAVHFRRRDKDVEFALDQLRSLRSEGLKVEIESSMKWFSKDIDSQMIKEIGSG